MYVRKMHGNLFTKYRGFLRYLLCDEGFFVYGPYILFPIGKVKR